MKSLKRFKEIKTEKKNVLLTFKRKDGSDFKIKATKVVAKKGCK